MTGTSTTASDPRRLRMDIAQRRLSRRALVRAGAGAGLAATVGARGWQRTASALVQDAAAPAGKIVISLAAEPSTLEWWNAFSIDGHPVLRNINEALLNRDPVTNELVGELAPLGTGWTSAPSASRCARG